MARSCRSIDHRYEADGLVDGGYGVHQSQPVYCQIIQLGHVKRCCRLPTVYCNSLEYAETIQEDSHMDLQSKKKQEKPKSRGGGSLEERSESSLAPSPVHIPN